MPKSRKLLAVPFVGKDVPSRASEFSHPDVVIGEIRTVRPLTKQIICAFEVSPWTICCRYVADLVQICCREGLRYTKFSVYDKKYMFITAGGDCSVHLLVWNETYVPAAQRYARQVDLHYLKLAGSWMHQSALLTTVELGFERGEVTANSDDYTITPSITA